MTRILVTGACGQLGRAIVERAVVTACDRSSVDVCDPAAVARAVRGHDVVINAAAFTNVDKAESERARAFAVNRDGARNLARACAAAGARLLHVSTDYVFDGLATTPYREDDTVSPLGAYGASKDAGDREVHARGGTVVRTSWLFGDGGPSFVHTMLRLAKERPVLRVVADQHGCPTYAGDLADALLALAKRPSLAHTYHFCGDGSTTWFGFAKAILGADRVEPIATADYPTAAKRPAYSVLDTSWIRALGIVPPSWTIGLSQVVARDA